MSVCATPEHLSSHKGFSVGSYRSFCQNRCIHGFCFCVVISSVTSGWIRYSDISLPLCFVHILFMLFVNIYINWCPTRFLKQIGSFLQLHHCCSILVLRIVFSWLLFVLVRLVIGLLFMNRSVNSNVQEFYQH